MIYIFDEEFVKKIQERYNIDRSGAYIKISKLVSTIKLDKQKKDNTFVSIKSSYNSCYTEKDIIDMLNGEEKQITTKKEPIASINIPPLMSSIKSSTLKLQSMKEIQEVKIEQRKNLLNIDVVDVINKISKKIIGQENAITTLVANIYHNQRLIESLESEGKKLNSTELDSRKVAILLDGTTGTGKTAIEKEISESFGLPLVIENANSFSETGYVGPSITDILEKLLKEADGDLEIAQKGIVVLDEIDKIAETDQESRSMKLGVQKELLGFMSGAVYEVRTSQGLFAPQIQFDTSKLTFILSGAFTSIKEAKIRQNNKKTLGFDIGGKDESDRTYTVDSQDYIDYGLMKEFFGRVKVIATTKTYSKEDLREILLKSEISPLKGFEKSCQMYGYPKVTYSVDFIDTIVEEAYKMETGARALQSLIQGIQDTMLMDLITKRFDVNKSVELTIDSLNKYKERRIRKY